MRDHGDELRPPGDRERAREPVDDHHDPPLHSRRRGLDRPAIRPAVQNLDVLARDEALYRDLAVGEGVPSTTPTNRSRSSACARGSGADRRPTTPVSRSTVPSRNGPLSFFLVQVPLALLARPPPRTWLVPVVPPPSDST